MKKINKIMCCCGNGVGTSLLMQMTMEEALSILGREDIEVGFGPITEISSDKADLYIVSKQYEEGLEDLADAEVSAQLLKRYLESE